MTIQFTCPHCGTQTNVDDQYGGKSGPCAACGQTISIPMTATVSVAAAKKTNKTPIVIAVLVIGAVLMFGLAIIGVLVALLLPAVNAARSAAQRAQCINNQKQIAVAIRAYHDEQGNFPPAYSVDDQGRPLHSWRVLILPYLGADENALYQQFDLTQPWDHPTNRRLVSQMPAVYRCPSDPASVPGETSYCVVEGEGFMFNADETTSEDDLAKGDGLAQTLMLVELGGSAIEWTEPRDIDAASLAQGINSGMPSCCGSRHPGGMVVTFADTSVTFLSDVTSPKELHDMATFEGGEIVEID